jgi:TolB-like protein
MNRLDRIRTVLVSDIPARIGRFRITRRLGEGGMGVVYVGTDDTLQRDVAIKLLRAETANPATLLREARVAARVQHPAVCTIFEVGESDGTPFIVMELLEGETVASRLTRGPLDPCEAAGIMMPTLDGLDALHQAGLVHLDVKPANIFITPHGVKLLDFGLARTHAAEGMSVTRSLSGMWAGTPAYMAPEQVRGEPVDPRTDIFAAGIVLFEMVAGESPFRGGTFVDVMQAVLTQHPPALSGSAALVAIDRIIQRALAKGPEDRYAGAAAMAAALREMEDLPHDNAPTQLRRVKRIAVLPFRLLRPDAEIDFLRIGLADAVGNSLAASDEVVVRSVLSLPAALAEATDLPRAARELDADLLLTGTLLRAANRVRVSAQLIEAGTGHARWSHQADASLDDLFALQDGLASGILASLPFGTPRTRGSGEIPRDEIAYSLYLQANQLAGRPQTWVAARSLYHQSTTVDPRFAPSWAALGRLERILGKYQVDGRRTEDGYAAAERALQRALALSPDLPQAHYHYAQLEADTGRTEEAMARLLARLHLRRTDPEIYAGLVLVCRFCGLLDASIAAHASARTLDPMIKTSVTLTRLARFEYETVLATATDDLDGDIRILALEALGRRAEALAIARADRPRISASDNISPSREAILALLEERTSDALEALDRVVELPPGATTLPAFPDGEDVYWTARFYTRLGRHDLGLAGVRAAVNQGYFCVTQLEREPWLDPIRHESGFVDTLAIARERHARAAAAFAAAGGPALLGVSF